MYKKSPFLAQEMGILCKKRASECLEMVSLVGEGLLSFQNHDVVTKNVASIYCRVLYVQSGAHAQSFHHGNFYLHIFAHSHGRTHLVKEDAILIDGILTKEGVYRSVAIYCATISKVNEGLGVSSFGADAHSLNYAPFSNYIVGNVIVTSSRSVACA